MIIKRRNMALVMVTAIFVVAIAFIVVDYDPDNFGDALLILAAISAWSFVLIFRRSAWRIMVIGRSLMYLGIGISLMLTQNVIFVVMGGPYQGRDLLRITLYFTLLMTFINMNFVTYVLQKRSVNLKKVDKTDGSAS